MPGNGLIGSTIAGHCFWAYAWALSFALGLSIVGCEKHFKGGSKVEAESAPTDHGVSLRATPAGDDGQWSMAGKDYENTRFSRLTQITSANVKALTLKWTQSTGVKRGHEAAPLVVNDTLFVVTPYPNQLLAFDLKTPGRRPQVALRPRDQPRRAGSRLLRLRKPRGRVLAGADLLQHARRAKRWRWTRPVARKFGESSLERSVAERRSRWRRSS